MRVSMKNKIEEYKELIKRMEYLICEYPYEETPEKNKLLRDVTKFHYEYNEFYNNLVKLNPFGNVENVKKPEDVPPFPVEMCKQSLGLYNNLLTVKELPVEYLFSSATHGDPSVVARTKEDEKIMKRIYRDRYEEYLNGFGEKLLAFAPHHSMFPQMQVSRVYEGISEIVETIYLVKVGKEGMKIDTDTLLKELTKFEKKENAPFTVGGSTPLMYYTLRKFKEKGLKWDFGERCKVGTGAGGWDGVKGKIKLPPIEKKSFIELMEYLFKTPPENVMDGYATSEISVFFIGHWSDEYNDFVYHTPVRYGDILIRDPKSWEILEDEGSEGLINIVTPLAPTTAGTNSLVVSDYVELVSSDKCDECGRKGPVFTRIRRAKESHKTGCGAQILKYLKELK